jgi:hypothetical protein
MKLNLEKQKYKRLENKLKRLYKNKQGTMFNSMRTSNPKSFHGQFRKRNSKFSFILYSSEWISLKIDSARL